MELNEFVKQSLLQIFEGISEAQKIVLEKNEGLINPVSDKNYPPEFKYLVSAVYSELTPIHFDVAVQVIEKDNAQAGLTVFSGFFGGGAKSGTEFQDATTSRIQFEVKVKFPGQLINETQRDFLKNRKQ